MNLANAYILIAILHGVFLLLISFFISLFTSLFTDSASHVILFFVTPAIIILAEFLIARLMKKNIEIYFYVGSYVTFLILAIFLLITAALYA